IPDANRGRDFRQANRQKADKMSRCELHWRVDISMSEAAVAARRGEQEMDGRSRGRRSDEQRVRKSFCPLIISDIVIRDTAQIRLTTSPATNQNEASLTPEVSIGCYTDVS
ncbi:hypothetical protein Hamer_G010714, partial [Homarus americanus]